MKVEMMVDPQEISHDIWFDESAQVIIVNLDRVSIAYSLDEFFDTIDRFEIARDSLTSDFNVVVGVYEVDGEKKKGPVIISEDEEYH
jgi:hypothetical protein